MHASDDAMQPQEIEAETAEINAKAKWYPFLVLAGVFGAALAVVKLFLTKRAPGAAARLAYNGRSLNRRRHAT